MSARSFGIEIDISTEAFRRFGEALRGTDAAFRRFGEVIEEAPDPPAQPLSTRDGWMLIYRVGGR